MLILGFEHTGSESTEVGKSHSWDLPTSNDSKPNAQTVSVALDNKDTTLGEDRDISGSRVESLCEGQSIMIKSAANPRALI